MTSPNGRGGASQRPPWKDQHPPQSLDETPDHVIRMQEFLARHPDVSWLRPGQAGVARHTATWIEPDPDPGRDGTPVTVSRLDLGWLVDYLEARFER